MPDGLGVLWDRLNAACAPAVSALAGWRWWDEPPDATGVPAGWAELSSGARWLEDANLYSVTFSVVGAVDHRPSKPTTAQEVSFVDAVLAAVLPSPVNALNPVEVSWQPGEVEIGSMTHRAMLVSVSLVYSMCY